MNTYKIFGDGEHFQDCVTSCNAWAPPLPAQPSARVWAIRTRAAEFVVIEMPHGAIDRTKSENNSNKYKTLLFPGDLFDLGYAASRWRLSTQQFAAYGFRPSRPILVQQARWAIREIELWSFIRKYNFELCSRTDCIPNTLSESSYLVDRIGRRKDSLDLRVMQHVLARGQKICIDSIIGSGYQTSE